MSQTTGLAYEAARKSHSVRNAAAAAYDEVIPHHTYSYMYRRRRIAVYAAVLKTSSAFNPAAIANADILYISGIYNDHIITDRTHGRCHRGRILHSHLPHPRNKFRPAAINGHGIGGLGRQPVINDNFIAPGLVEHRDLDTVSKGRRTVSEDDVDILNECSPTYRIVRYVIADILY